MHIFSYSSIYKLLIANECDYKNSFASKLHIEQ